jgi:NAD(P)-dependent dehydrogenase (short-subunit alcohol dehydrogenase family)
MELQLRDKRVLVTAGAAGIGRAIVAACRAAGARLHVCDIDAEALASLRADCPEIGTSLCDVADSAAADRLFDELGAGLGGLDALVNNAGIAGPTKPVEDIADEEWERTLAVNITGQFFCARRAVPMLKAAGGGAIVNISSAAGRFGYPLRSPYAASKWAVVGFSHTLAVELGPHNISVNAILPGPVAGERIDRVIRAKAEQRGVEESVMRDVYLDMSGMRQFVTAEDVARMVLYLLSDAGQRVSGQAIGVDAATYYIR